MDAHIQHYEIDSCIVMPVNCLGALTACSRVIYCIDMGGVVTRSTGRLLPGGLVARGGRISVCGVKGGGGGADDAESVISLEEERNSFLTVRRSWLAPLCRA